MFVKPLVNADIISESSRDYAKKASPEVKAAVERARRTANKTTAETAAAVDLKEEIRAKYKIEVIFDKNRTMKGANAVGIQLWESGKKFHGGGDESMFFCKDGTRDNGEGCWAPIKSDMVRGDVAYCVHCKKGIVAARLAMMKTGRVTNQNLAIEIAKLFRQLDSNCDIYLKYHKTDIRYIAMERAKGPETARKLKGMHIYPLARILTDTANGADLTKRFFAFITS